MFPYRKRGKYYENDPWYEDDDDYECEECARGKVTPKYVEVITEHLEGAGINADEFDKGVDDVSRICGQFSALKSVGIPTVEVHLSDINTREEFRKFSYVSLYAEKMICGKKFEGYKEAILYLKEKEITDVSNY